MRSLLLFLLISIAAAQSDRSTITGTISDPGGGVIPNAPIEARNLATGILYTAQATATGNYTLAELPVGTYEVSVAVSGFKKFVRTGLAIQAAQIYRVDITLEVGAASESVTVSEAAPLLKTDSGELGHNITAESLNTLPVLGIGSAFASNSGIRNPMAVTSLIPGGIFTGDVTVRVNGAPNNTHSLRVEGQDSTNATMVAFGSQNQPSVDSIQEFAVQTSNYAAEFGQAGGGVFIATMKSGTNNFHGSGYDYFVNEALNANVAFVNMKPRARRNDYGVTLGGPFWMPKIYDGHNRTFFFYNFEQFRENTVVNNVPLTVPTEAYRRGDFSRALTGRNLCPAANPNCDPLGRPIMEGQIYDPRTTRVENGQMVRDPFMGNQIDPTRFDPVAFAIQNLFPLPSGPNAAALNNNYLPAYVGIRHTDINSIKVDQLITSRSKLSIFYSRTHTYSPYSQVLAGDGLPPKITVGRGNYDFVHTTRVNYDHTLMPTILLHVGAGYVNQHGPFDYTPALDSFDPASIGLKGTFKTGRFPSMTGLCPVAVPAGASNPVVCGGTGGMVNIGPTTSGGSPEDPTDGGIFSFRPTANVSLNWIRRNHSYKTGAEVIIGNFMYAQDFPGGGVFNFNAGETSLPYLAPLNNLGGGSPGFAYASFLLGAVDNGNIGVATDQHFGQKAFALFIQDSWKVTRKLTLDYGLRWDYVTYMREGAGRMPSFSATTKNPSAGNLPGATIFDGFLPGRCQCHFAYNYPYAIGPRIGAAYQITPKTVFRAGFGVVYAKTAAYDNITIASVNPFISPGQFAPSMYLQNGVPIVPKPWPNFDLGQFPNIPGQIAAPPPPTPYALVDPNAGRPPRQLQWSIGIQREIMRDLVVEAAFVGNRGAWWTANTLVSYNALTPQMLTARGLDLNKLEDRTLLASPLSSSIAISRGFGTPPYPGFGLNNSVAQSLRPFPQFGNINGYYAPLGDTWYDSLQVKVTKRLSHGLDAGYSLAWQKSLTIGAESEGTGGAGTSAPAVNDVFNRPINKYLSLYDQPLVSQLSVSYTLPKRVEGRSAAGKALSEMARDWTINAELQYRSGLPIQAPQAQNNLNSLLLRANTSPPAAISFANRVPGVPLFKQDLNCHCFDPAKTFVLNPAAWSDPAPGQFGGGAAYYSDYRYQRRPAESIGLGRIFRIKERATLSIRAEFTNVFNRTEMNNPTATNALATPLRADRNDPNSKTTGGFGWINTGSTFSLPRQGTIVARFQF